ncbi:MAG: antibiotic biosynthesis monooxygenase [Gammaproteobacteria bacterium]|nr:antibiotic biosynthesis monooxygenase [Gammaproteobacteria bacterium]
MATDDKCCSIYPYFKVHAGKLDEFRAGCEKFMERTSSEPGCLYYGFSFEGMNVHCREGYRDADALLHHLDNVGDLLREALKIADLARLEIHGPEDELDKLREPLAQLHPQFYQLDYGFRR